MLPFLRQRRVNVGLERRLIPVFRRIGRMNLGLAVVVSCEPTVYINEHNIKIFI